MPERAFVRLGQAVLETIDYDGEQVTATIPDAVELTCSECGPLTDWLPVVDGRREWLQLAAYRHAEEQHDGDVDREGWV